ncbi:SR- and CTD-associated factor 8 [Cichlidogyrus casuarinus]|uniref:SR- and CTD-associated factor 8 n=1 Tax=Cichlidogyrus casuarinus TaxID=1844966 RepID=A0ABD2PVG8_9PLAT
MDPLQAFNAELQSLLESRVPVSRPKILSITKLAMKAIRQYKFVVQMVEKLIYNCPSEYKVPGLYVLDAIIRQSRQIFQKNDLFAPRFLKNLPFIFCALCRLPDDSKRLIFKVLDLWRENCIFPHHLIQSLTAIMRSSGEPESVERAKQITAKLTENIEADPMKRIRQQLDERLLHIQDKVTQHTASIHRGEKINSQELNKFHLLVADLLKNCQVTRSN